MRTENRVDVANCLTVRWTSAKGGQGRVARLDEIAAVTLDSYIRDFRPDVEHDRIFLTAAGKPFTYNGFANHLSVSSTS